MIDTLCDETWAALRSNYFRRAILGRRRCDELVLHTLAEFPDREYVSRKAAEGSGEDRRIRAELESRVSKRFRSTPRGSEPYGSVFLSLVLMWAISAIVQHLVLEWWKRRFDMATIRREAGWR